MYLVNGERPAQNRKYIIDTSLPEKFRATIPLAEEMANRKNINVPCEFSDGSVQNLLYGTRKEDGFQLINLLKIVPNG